VCLCVFTLMCERKILPFFHHCAANGLYMNSSPASCISFYNSVSGHPCLRRAISIAGALSST
jgi:hypothetical protein